MARNAEQEQSSNESRSYNTNVDGARVDGIAVGPNSRVTVKKTFKTKVNKRSASLLWIVVVALIGVASTVYLRSPILSPWDGAARGWARAGQCASPEATGYFLRVSYKENKDASFKKIKRAWDIYVNEYYDITGGKYPAAKEVVFFDEQKNAGAGILFEAVPSGWTKLLKDHPEWIPLGAGDQPVTAEVCVFRADESRRPTTGGW